MNIRAFAILTLLVARPLAAESVPFDICAEPTTWVRPSPEVQAKIWNDLRYKAVAGTAYAWTHNFIVIDEPMSASIPYHLMNTSGVWTATSGAFAKCYSAEYARRSGYEWIKVWALLHRVTHVEHDNNTYTITVEPTGKGFQFVFIRRLNPSAVLRFVTPDGRELEKWDESDPPDRPHNSDKPRNDVPPGTPTIGPNGEIIRK